MAGDRTGVYLVPRARWHHGAVELLDAEQRPLRASAGRIALALVVVASFGIWAYAYSGRADRPAPDLLDDPGFAAAAEPVCAAARAKLDRLEPAPLATDHVDRAATIDEANLVLADMLQELRAQTPATDRDRQIVGDWLTDWETYLEDRRSFASRLSRDPDARFYQSDVANEPLDRRLSRLADTNRMSSCGAPGDVG